MEIFEQIAELKDQINELESEGRRLKAGRGTISEGYHDPVSDQTYGSGDYLGDQNAEQRLSEIRDELSRLRRELAELERLQTAKMQKELNKQNPKVSAYGRTPTQAHMSSSAFAVETDKGIAEEARRRTFKDVRNAYRKGKGSNKFDKLLYFLTGQRPKWGQIKKYDQATLEHLLSTYYGNTRTTKDMKGSIENNIKNQVTTAELNRRIAASNWRTFTRLLRHRDQLKQDMKIEGRGRR